jgi:hypothetical protein
MDEVRISDTLLPAAGGMMFGTEAPPTNPVPEPSTYALGLIGLAGLGLFAWRKKYRRA